jgi:hypothetical protein
MNADQSRNRAKASADQIEPHDFCFFVDDDRYTVPVFEFVFLSSAERARELAAEKLAASAHHRSIEVMEGEQVVFRLSRDRP